MARIFNMKIFDNMMDSFGADSEFEIAETLGRADTIIFFVRVTAPGGTNPTITLKYQHGANGKQWVDAVTLLNAVSISTSPYESVVDTSGTDLAALGRLSATLGGTNPQGQVEIWATGRTS